VAQDKSTVNHSRADMRSLISCCVFLLVCGVPVRGADQSTPKSVAEVFDELVSNPAVPIMLMPSAVDDDKFKVHVTLQQAQAKVEERLRGYGLAAEQRWNGDSIAGWGGTWTRKDASGYLRVVISVGGTFPSNPPQDEVSASYSPASLVPMAAPLLSHFLEKASTVNADSDSVDVRLPLERTGPGSICWDQRFLRVSLEGAVISNTMMITCDRRRP
jgi:hypothetical protein